MTRVDEFLEGQRNQPYSYSELGGTRDGNPPSGYTIDRNTVRLGCGSQVFQKAAAALRKWQMFKLGWLEVFPGEGPIAPGAIVGVRVHHFGFWSLNACRIVYVLEEERRYGFAYGTLPDHAELGEERFLVAWLPDDSVVYEILAFSNPKNWLAKVARPAGRALQKRFAKHSMGAMVRAIQLSPD